MSEYEYKIPEGFSSEIKAKVEAVLAIRFPELPKEPETGIWYRISPKGCVTSTGTPWHGSFRLGKENRLIIQLGGGGVSWSEYMAARPIKLEGGAEPQFYFSDTSWASDAQVHQGLCLQGEANPFSDWSVLVLPYSSGDFHCGTSEFPYTALDGTDKILYHHGYINYHAAMKEVQWMVTKPEKVLICGESAGGFGTALLTDDVMSLFPDCSDFTCCVDSALLLKTDWPEAARVWGTPEAIAACLHSDNITLDMLRALYEKQGSRVKILFVCSIRDMALINMQNYVDTGNMTADKASADQFQKNLSLMCEQLQREIPECGLFFFDLAIPGTSEEDHLTIHTVLMEPTVYEPLCGTVTVMEWLWQAVNGNVQKIGMELLS